MIDSYLLEITYFSENLIDWKYHIRYSFLSGLFCNYIILRMMVSVKEGEFIKI